ncbi:MAG: GlsB/YeaQ/YmgE family stress response membrane protein [Kofleriaceae bacterium]
MHILWMLIIGLIVGALAKLIMPGKDPGGIIVTMLLGVAGSLLAGFLGRAFGWYSEGQGAGFIASIIGALVLLAIYRAIIGRRAHEVTTRTPRR